MKYSDYICELLESEDGKLWFDKFLYDFEHSNIGEATSKEFWQTVKLKAEEPTFDSNPFTSCARIAGDYTFNGQGYNMECGDDLVHLMPMQAFVQHWHSDESAYAGDGPDYVDQGLWTRLMEPQAVRISEEVLKRLFFVTLKYIIEDIQNALSDNPEQATQRALNLLGIRWPRKESTEIQVVCVYIEPLNVCKYSSPTSLSVAAGCMQWMPCRKAGRTWDLDNPPGRRTPECPGVEEIIIKLKSGTNKLVFHRLGACHLQNLPCPTYADAELEFRRRCLMAPLCNLV